MAQSRPKTTKTKAEKRDRPYTVRYNDEEERMVESAAKDRSLEVASWIRMVSVEAARGHAQEKASR